MPANLSIFVKSLYFADEVPVCLILTRFPVALPTDSNLVCLIPAPLLFTLLLLFGPQIPNQSAPLKYFAFKRCCLLVQKPNAS